MDPRKKGLQTLYNLILKDVVKGSGQASGIMSIGGDVRKLANKRFQTYITAAQKQGVDLDNMSAEEIRYILELNKPQPIRAIPADSPEGQGITRDLFNMLDRQSGKNVIKKDFGKPFAEEKSVKELMESGQVQKGTQGLKKSDKVVKREMFEEANEKFNKTDEVVTVDSVITGIKKLEPIEAMKEANRVLKGEGRYKNLSKVDREKIAGDESVTDHIFEREIKLDPEDMAQGGRASHYTGGMVDVEPNLSDIGHGSDSLMSRTRLVAPNSQATTSTGLNYLLAEDNDNIRVPFAAGGGGRRAFLKMLGLTGAGIAGAKTGILGLGEGAGKKAITETVKQSVGSGQPPPYFFKLVDKIKTMGDDVTKKSATQEREVVTKYKDFELTENIATGEKTIQRKKPSDFEYYDEQLYEDVYMNYKPGKGQADEAAPKVADEYTEDTSYIRTSGPQKGDVYDTVDGVPKDVVQEGSVFEDNMTEFGMTKKADGGRIGFSGGNLAKFLAGKKITGSSRTFLEKVFGKERFENMIRNDPEMHRGMLEVVEMFRNRDKEGLKMYLQKFLPHMDDATVEDFIIGSGDTAGIEGQLIRLGSGRDYKGKIEMIKEADNRRKLNALDVSKMKPNAEGGRIGLFLGGPLTIGKGQLKKLLEYMAKGSSHGKTGSEMLQMVNPKQFNKMLNDPATMGKFTSEAPEGIPGLVREYISKIKKDRANMVEDLIGTGRKMKKADDDIITYKIKIIEDMVSKGMDRKTAENMAEMLGKMVSDQSGLTKKAVPKITEQGLLEMENIQKNLLTKDRKLQATGGLTTMLGE
jgi:hypothetical protein